MFCEGAGKINPQAMQGDWHDLTRLARSLFATCDYVHVNLMEEDEITDSACCQGPSRHRLG